MDKKGKRSPFDNDQLQLHLKKLFLRDDLHDLSRRLRDHAWIERLKEQEPDFDSDAILEATKNRYRELEDEYLKIKTDSLRAPEGKGKVFFAHADPFKQESATGDSLRTYENTFKTVCGPSHFTGALAIDDLSVRTREYLADNSTAEGEMTKPDEPPPRSTMGSRVYMINRSVYYDAYVINPSYSTSEILLSGQVLFSPPPAPFDGKLRWEVFTKTHLSFTTSSLGRVRVHLVSAVLENAPEPIDEPIVIYPEDANLFNHLGDSVDGQSGLMRFGGNFNVVEGQQSEIYFLLLVRLMAIYGRADVEGYCPFCDPDPFGSANPLFGGGLRFMYW